MPILQTRASVELRGKTGRTNPLPLARHHPTPGHGRATVDLGSSSDMVVETSQPRQRERESGKLTTDSWTHRIGEFMNFFSRTVAERTPSGQRQSVQENSYTAHAYSRQSDHLTGVLITDQEYPVRVAFSLLNKILDEFTTKIPRSTWQQRATEGRNSGAGAKQVLVSSQEYPELAQYVQKYQDPRQADSIMKVQQELDETKIILASRARGGARFGSGEKETKLTPVSLSLFA